jgi:hypothetical protein
MPERCENRRQMTTAAELAAQAGETLAAADLETVRRLFSEALAQEETHVVWFQNKNPRFPGGFRSG